MVRTLGLRASVGRLYLKLDRNQETAIKTLIRQPLFWSFKVITSNPAEDTACVPITSEAECVVSAMCRFSVPLCGDFEGDYEGSISCSTASNFTPRTLNRQF